MAYGTLSDTPEHREHELFTNAEFYAWIQHWL